MRHLRPEDIEPACTALSAGALAGRRAAMASAPTGVAMHRTLLPLLLAVACAGEEPAETDADPADTDPAVETDTDTDAVTIPGPTTGDLILPCHDLPFTIACYAVSSGYETCSDYF